MKTTFLLAALLATTISFSQMFVGIGVGISTTKTPAMNLQTGYDFNIIQVQGGYKMHLDRRNAAIFYGQLAKKIWINNTFAIEPAIGYSHHLLSNDKKWLNKNNPIYSIGLVKQLEHPNGQLFFDITNSGVYSMAVIGLRCSFIN